VDTQDVVEDYKAFVAHRQTDQRAAPRARVNTVRHGRRAWLSRFQLEAYGT
jgi:hypothetical protein